MKILFPRLFMAYIAAEWDIFLTINPSSMRHQLGIHLAGRIVTEKQMIHRREPAIMKEALARFEVLQQDYYRSIPNCTNLPGSTDCHKNNNCIVRTPNSKNRIQPSDEHKG
jgi:hypothetical protein